MREIIFLNERTKINKMLLSGQLDSSKVTREELLSADASRMGERAGGYIPYGQDKVKVNRKYAAQGKILADMSKGKTTDNSTVMKLAGNERNAELARDHANMSAKHILHDKEAPQFIPYTKHT